MKGIVSILALIMAFSIVPAVFAGTNYNCSVGTVTLDGNLADWVGAEFILVPHDKGRADGQQLAPDDADASFDFAVLVDDGWLYVAMNIKDDAIVTGENDNHTDDSAEIYIDANHSATETYDDDDVQIRIGAWDIGGNVQNPQLGGSGADTGTRAAVVETATGWIVEAAIPLKNNKWDIKPTAGLVIGFNVQINDDDDGGGRDHKLIWSDLDVDDRSYNNPTRFADLTFTGTASVELADKLAITWGSIK